MLEANGEGGRTTAMATLPGSHTKVLINFVIIMKTDVTASN